MKKIHNKENERAAMLIYSTKIILTDERGSEFGLKFSYSKLDSVFICASM